MNSKKIAQLTQRCKYLRPIFIGVYARDTLPTKRLSKRKSWALIVNLDTHLEAGSHWVAIYMPRKSNYIEYWDSTGRPPRHTTIWNFLNQRDRCYFNNIRLQSSYTTTCGQYCLFFLCSRVHGLTRKEILHFFKSDNLIFNDRFVNRVVQDIFKSRIQLINHEFLRSQIMRYLM